MTTVTPKTSTSIRRQTDIYLPPIGSADFNALPWPKRSPVLTPANLCLVPDCTETGPVRCLWNWLAKTFPSIPMLDVVFDVLWDEFTAIRGYCGKDEFLYFAEYPMMAAVWNRAMKKLGYIVPEKSLHYEGEVTHQRKRSRRR